MKRETRRVVGPESAASLSARRLRPRYWTNVFAIEIEICRRCGRRLRVIASIEGPAVIERILEHLGR